MTSKDELIEQALGFQEKINELITEYSSENWLSLDLSIGQLKSLVYINNKGKTNHRELARVLKVTPSVVTGIIDRLEAHMLVAREPDINDRRVQWLTISDKGRQIIDRIDRKNKKEVKNVLATMNDADLSALVSGFSSFLKAAEAYLEQYDKKAASTESFLP